MASGVRARTPRTMTVLDPGRSVSPDSAARPPSSGRRSITKSFSLEMRRSSLEVLSSDHEEGERRVNSAGSSGRRSALEVLDSPGEPRPGETRPYTPDAGDTRPGSGGRRPYTPNKQVSLKVARKKPEVNGILLPSPKRESSPKLPNRTQQTASPVPAATGVSDRGRGQLGGEEEEMKQRLERLELEEGRRRECKDTSQGKSDREVPIQPGEDPSSNVPGEAGGPQVPPAEPEQEDDDDDEEEGSDDSDDDEDDDDESDDEIKAPFELLGEFLESVMKEEYETAQKLCQMILIYEPENPEALQFKPLIEERLQQEAEAEEESSSSEGSTDDDDDNDDDDDDESTSSSEEEDDEEEENTEQKSKETEADSEKKVDNSQPTASTSKYPPTFLTN